MQRIFIFFSQGHDCLPKLFKYSDGNVTFVNDLDIPKEKETGTMRLVIDFFVFLIYSVFRGQIFELEQDPGQQKGNHKILYMVSVHSYVCM